MAARAGRGNGLHGPGVRSLLDVRGVEARDIPVVRELRAEPNDIFKGMSNAKSYGWTIVLYEYNALLCKK